ncbi:PREDICTED: macrophage mannose receptor 1-like [Papilio polytes]|uniref:macrophage mannose receptor 1-like n=1 Tax=Papilio polytes TaxID=76194 RepID=UPI0006761857|nr:PREDICTED: macrophage mannose receptor 1-like [Papilio polytes]
MSLKILLKIIVLLCCESVLGHFSQLNEYRYDYKHISEIDGWIKIHLFPTKWKDARLRCQFEGAVLASPETPALALILKSIAAERFPCGLYTGVHATFSPGDYFSVEGTPIARMPIEWAPNEPDNHEGKEECIILQGNGTAADVVCTDLYPYVCYRRGPVTLNECGSVDPGYVYERRTGSCYKFHYVGRNWTRAFMACASEGAHLAIPNSQLETTVLAELFGQHPASNISGVITDIVHIGFQNWGERRTWTTIHGQSLQEAGYSTFDRAQPDFFGHKVFCGGMFRSGKLDDFQCDEQAPFICEKYPDSLLRKTHST